METKESTTTSSSSKKSRDRGEDSAGKSKHSSSKSSHSTKTSTQSSSTSNKPTVKPNFEFQCDLTYHNTLPSVPCGPYFVDNEKWTGPSAIIPTSTNHAITKANHTISTHSMTLSGNKNNSQGVHTLENMNTDAHSSSETLSSHPASSMQGLPPSLRSIHKSILIHPLSKYGEYKLSTLEKNYTWLPHVSVDINMNIDLVDQEAMLYLPDKPVLDPMDELYLKPVNTSNLHGSSNLSKANIKGPNPWWLRNTTYLENNLFSQTHKTRQDTMQELKTKKFMHITNSQNSENSQDLNVLINEKYANLTEYEISDLKLDELIKEKKAKKGLTMEWCCDIVPNVAFEDMGQYVSYVKYDEPPLKSLNSNQLAKASEPNSEQSKKIKNLMNNSVITNIRTLQSKKLAKSTAFECSLVVPKFSNGPTVDKTAPDASIDGDDKDVESTNKTSSTVKYEDNPHVLNTETEIEMEWVKDYIMDSQIQQSNDKLCFFSIIPPKFTPEEEADVTRESRKRKRGMAMYSPIRSYIKMVKLPREEAKPVDVTITRLSS